MSIPHRFLLCTLLLLVSLPAQAGAPTIPRLSAEQSEALRGGEVVLLDSEEGDGSESFAVGLVEMEASPDRVWSILLSIEHTRRSSRSVRELSAYRDETDAAGDRFLNLAYVLKVGFSDVRYHVQRHVHTAESWMDWKLDPSRENDIQDTSGTYSTHPGSAPGRTVLLYRARVRTGKRLPRWIEEELTESNLKRYLAYVRDTAPTL